jgi:predicted kinase
VNESRLYILCGLPFAGKTTLAKELVKQFGFMHIDVDQINTSFGVGLSGAAISPEPWERTYIEAYKQLKVALDFKCSVIFEGANYTKELRDRLKAIAAVQGVESQVIYVDISESEARQRLLDNRVMQHRHDIRDDNFALVVTYFEPPTQEEQVIYFQQSEPLDEWIMQNFKRTNH